MAPKIRHFHFIGKDVVYLQQDAARLLKHPKPGRHSQRKAEAPQATAICFRSCRCPPSNAQKVSAGNRSATGCGHLFFTAFEAAVCPPSNACRPCKRCKLCRRLCQRSKLPFARPQTATILPPQVAAICFLRRSNLL